MEIQKIKNKALSDELGNKQLCDVCGSYDVIEAPSMGKNCNNCNPIQK